eukprot:c20476_g1_i2.p1 GENE.c20476_g1_i2~~c20476_g1_i2.p1  ORF type:complete len:550 (+),score=112.27 c20476_g1_i2:1192-2841(+)
MAKVIFESLERLTRVKYGYAHVGDVTTGALDDRMSSFFLAETCKYLYLLFDPENFVNKNLNYVFSTEGHLFPISPAIHARFANPENSKTVTSALTDIAEQLQKLRSDCSLVTVGYWTYELCHGRHVRQWHQTASGQRQSEHLLGGFKKNKINLQFVPQPEGELYSVELTPGDVCDSTGLARRTTVHYDCDPHRSIPVLFIQETTPCSYIVKLQTKHACADTAAKISQLKHVSAESMICPVYVPSLIEEVLHLTLEDEESEALAAQLCSAPSGPTKIGPLTVEMGIGSFLIRHTILKEFVIVRNLGRPVVEVIDHLYSELVSATISSQAAFTYFILASSPSGNGQESQAWAFPASLAAFSHEFVSAVLLATGQTSTDQIFIKGAGVILNDQGCEVPAKGSERFKGKLVYVDRGQCSFAQKVRNAYAGGAVGVIVGNTQMPDTSGGDNEELETVFMMDDDGTQRNALIPALMVSRSHAAALKSALNNQPAVQIDIMRRTLPSIMSEQGGEGAGVVVSGNPTGFQFKTLGGWTLHVQQQGAGFVLSVSNLGG